MEGRVKAKPCICIEPGMLFGKPHIADHRLNPMQFAEMWWGGNWTLEAIADNWPGIGKPEVVISCWYAADYGPRKWRKRWSEWADTVFELLWYGDYDVPMPPTGAV
jgi:uncharacterized protein (DUF433 family)